VDPKAIDFFPKHYWMISKLHPCSLHLVTGYAKLDLKNSLTCADCIFFSHQIKVVVLDAFLEGDQ